MFVCFQLMSASNVMTIFGEFDDYYYIFPCAYHSKPVQNTLNLFLYFCDMFIVLYFISFTTFFHHFDVEAFYPLLILISCVSVYIKFTLSFITYWIRFSL